MEEFLAGVGAVALVLLAVCAAAWMLGKLNDCTR